MMNEELKQLSDESFRFLMELYFRERGMKVESISREGDTDDGRAV